MTFETLEKAKVFEAYIVKAEEQKQLLQQAKSGHLRFGFDSGKYSYLDEKVFTTAKKSQIKILQAEIDRLEKEFKAL